MYLPASALPRSAWNAWKRLAFDAPTNSLAQVAAHNAALLAAPDDPEAAADALTQLLAGHESASARARIALEPALGNLALVLLGAGELGRVEALLAENRALVGSERLPQVRLGSAAVSKLLKSQA